MEVKKQKEEDKIERQLAVNREDTATEVQMITPARPIVFDLFLMSWKFGSFDRFSNVCLCVLQETVFREQVEGLVEEENEEEEEAAAPNEEEEDIAVGAIAVAEKKTERQRKKEKAEKIKVHPHFILDSF